MKKIDWKTCFRVGVSAFVLFLCIHYWPNISGFIGKCFTAAAPVFTGFVMAYIINILMSFYERHFFPNSKKKSVAKSRRPVSLTGAILTVIGVIALVIVLIAPQLVNCIEMLVNQLPGAIEKLIAKLNGLSFVSDELIASLASIDWKSRIGDIAQTLFSGVGDVMNVAVSAVSSIFTGIMAFVIGFIVALYLLMDKDKLGGQCKRVMNSWVPGRFLEKVMHVVCVADDCFRRFIVGQCTEAVILGSLCMVGMLILRLPYAPMVGALIAFTALIPIVGGLIGAGVGAFLILMVSPVKALIFIIFIIVLQQIEGNLIYPKVVGSSMGLPALWVLAAVTVGGGVLGIGGMLIGVPMAAVVYRLIKESLNEKESAVAAQAEQEVVCSEQTE
ncbi:MAG: AI-2E family transporter [Clostridia bacterium]|nr:AI-2E family transporter [Clostridia bacterium]MBQ6930861.1 AI-2E family transporter [Clostridia bacterium]